MSEHVLESREIATLANTKFIGHYVDGQYVSSYSRKRFHTRNPHTGEEYADVALGQIDDVDRAVAAAKVAFEDGPWTKMSIEERCKVLRRIGDLILEHKETLARAESIDTGKPISESYYGDIPRAAKNFHFYAQFAPSYIEECFSVGHNERHIAIREPAGVAALITPWNLPLYLASWKIAPCLAMGNTCVLKPAEWTPMTAYLLAQITKDAGLPNGVFNVVNGYGPRGAGEWLVSHPDVSMISFTGETNTGRAIMAKASDTLKKVSFELGGKGANIIFEDCDIDRAIDTAISAAYRNQGQICLAGSRLFVQESIYVRVLAEVAKRVQDLRVGDPLNPETEMGAIISEEQLRKVESYIAIARAEAQVVCGGKRLDAYPNGYFLSPSVIADLLPTSRLLKEEIFGPVLPIIPFHTEDEVISMVNDVPYGLSCSIWSNDINRCHRMSQAIKAGIVWVNCWFVRDLRTPFGGQKNSGIGREGGRYSLEFFSEAKTITYKYG
jgi:aminomuconate-semialdehyde/2-hydroxymuconate-6-semialdehyde dehydrogenase